MTTYCRAVASRTTIVLFLVGLSWGLGRPAFGQLAADGDSGEALLFINEVMASNSTTVEDPQRDYDDWIELYNGGSEPVDIGGMYLTDNPSDPTKWQVPARNPALTRIPPHGYLLIWADTDLGATGLHAGFNLSAAGDEVALFDRDGATLIDQVSFGQQETDVSFGRLPDGGDTWQPFASPTPGLENLAVYEGFVAEPTMSPERGLYDAEVSVTLTTATEGATIYYTTDGSEPYKLGGRFPTGRVYDRPLGIAETTCLRAKAIKPGWRSSSIVTHTYLFVADVARQSTNGAPPGPEWPTGNVNGQVLDYGMDPQVTNDPRYAGKIDNALLAIPSISLVTDVDNLFGAQNGIYVHPQNQGRRWERPASVELLNRDSSAAFHIDAGLRIRGGFSRSTNNPKHAFRLMFRSEYGGVLRFPLFGDEGTDTFDNVDLRTSQNYSWSFQGDSQNTMVREVFSRDVQGETGHPYTRSRYYHLYLNGQYWGLYQTQERSEASYAASYFGGSKEDYDVVKVEAGSYSMVATDGNTDAFRRLYDAVMAGLDNTERYYRVQGLNPDGTRNPSYERLLDVENLIDFMIIEYYTGDRDGPGSRFVGRPNNTYGIYNRLAPDGWKWFHHDNEHTLGVSSSETNMVTPFTSAGSQWPYFNPHWLHERLARTNADYRMHFGDHVYRHFFNDGVLTPQNSIARVWKRAAQIDTAIIAESARWGDAKRSSPYTKATWDNEVSRLVTSYLPNREQVVLGQLKSVGWYPSVDPPMFNQHGGPVAAGFALQMSAPGTVIYYTRDGSDPRQGEQPPVNTITTTLIAERAAKRALVPTGPIDDAWKGGQPFDDTDWALVTGSPGGIGYEQETGYEDFISLDVGASMYRGYSGCYVRIPFNVGGVSDRFDVMTLNALYDDGFVAYLNGVEILRVQAPGTPTWNSLADGNHEALGPETFDVSSHIGRLRTGENILAIHAMNTATTSSDFVISAGLVAQETSPPAGNSNVTAGALRYTSPVTLTQSTHIKARALNGGVWSALHEARFAVGPVAESLRISEIMYHPAETGNPDDPNTEYIELTHIGATTVNLNLARFTNGVDFTFPAFDLAPGDYCLVVKDIAAFEAKYGQGYNIAGQYSGSLNNGGERVELQDAAGQTIHDFRYRDGWYKLTDGPGFSLTVKAPADTDPSILSRQTVWRPSAHADGSPGYDDTGLVPELGTVVINELMAYPTPGEPDWIELHNTTDQTLDIAGWFLSDDADDLTKYEIAEGTRIEPWGYCVFYEDQHFGNLSDPGCHVPFGLSRNGETVYLHSGADGVITGYSQAEDFGPSEVGVSVGRWLGMTAESILVALREPTPGSDNADPQGDLNASAGY